MRGNTKHLVFSVCVAFVLLCAFAGVSVASARTIYVPDDYEKIQWAVNHASAGDTIIVRDGIYYESITVSKQLTIKSEKGPDNCIVDGTSSDVFTLKADGIRIEGFTITGGENGIYILSNNNTIINNNISSNNDNGIELWYSNNNSISNNIIRSNKWNGIRLGYSNNNSISNNNISSNNVLGLFLWNSNNNIISNNIIRSNNDDGIYFSHSNENTIRKNEFINDGIFIYDSYSNIVEDNEVNGKPLVYLENESDKIIDNAGQIILVRCSNITVMNAELTNTDIGIELFESDNCLISNSIISSNNFDGIFLRISNNNSISNNIIRSNNDDGIELWYSNNNSISNNNISSNKWDGMWLGYSNNNSVSNNIISNNWCGISLLWHSNNNIISDNIIGSNKEDGISLIDSNNNSILNNNISSNGDCGIALPLSNKSSISKNIISSNKYGIFLCDSNENIIYLNNFINNTYNAFSLNPTNIWNSTEQITYTYRGSKFKNYMGNYWSDYTGSDDNGDGIGDTPYSIDSDRDNYPLIERFENYFVPTPAQTFDTGRPENPYPSISGEFVGTIKTNKKIIAKKLYTYACEGTGGHTEYALICNDSFCAEAKWEGYKGDWMNISFNRTVVLMPYETYNITIVTGSYPQIHHTSALQTENGWINCTEFTDANGKKYENWIPAIKLWS